MEIKNNHLVTLISDFHYHKKIHWKTLSDVKRYGQAWVESITSQYPEFTNDAKDVLYNEIAYRAQVYGTSTLLGLPNNVLIMKGGGIKGLAYVGALDIINRFYNFNWYSGTSAGAITAVLLSSGHSVEDLKSILINKNFNDFKDAGFRKKIINILFHQGLYKADTFVKWLDELLSQKLNIQYRVRLSDLPTRVTIYASKRNKPALIFDSAKPDSSSQSAAFAARCSMSIPGIFTPQKSEGLNVFDGGLQNNFPVEILLKDNPDTNFIGFYLGDATYKWQKNSIINDVKNIWLEGRDEEVLRMYGDKIVVIDTNPISLLNFKLSEPEKSFLLEAGQIAALDFVINRGFEIDDSERNGLKERKEAHEKVRQKLIIIKMNRKRKRKRIFITILVLLIIIVMYLFGFFNFIHIIF